MRGFQVCRWAIVAAVSLLTALGCSSSGGQVEIGSTAGTSPEAVRTFLEAIVGQRGGPPSVSVAVAVDGEVVLAEAVGLADIKKKVAATPETRYRAYSISKGITAIAVMRLVEREKLRLDDDIRLYVPEYPPKAWPVTIRHLLSHTSGIRHYKKNAGEISSQVEYASLADSLVVFRDDPLEFEPGTAYRYSTFGFNLLTGAIEKASGAGLGASLEVEILAPSGMTASGLDVEGRSDPSMATGYGPGKRKSRRSNVSGRYGSSGVVSTPTDLVRLFVALEAGSLLGPEGLESLFVVADPDLSEQQAFGWRVAEEEGRRVVYGTGGGMGFSGLVFHYPDQRVTGALLINQAEFGQRVELLGAVLAPHLAGR